MDTIYRAYFETRNFEFETFAFTEERVLILMQEAWDKHCSQFVYADPELYSSDQVHVSEIKIESMLRDREEF